jgi:hypothetical protein
MTSSAKFCLWKLMLAARALQQRAVELERQRAADSLRKGLERRPEREELVERGGALFRRRVAGKNTS